MELMENNCYISRRSNNHKVAVLKLNIIYYIPTRRKLETWTFFYDLKLITLIHFGKPNEF